MEISKLEVNAVADVAAALDEVNVIELAALQLALVGGGVGEVVLS